MYGIAFSLIIVRMLFMTEPIGTAAFVVSIMSVIVGAFMMMRSIDLTDRIMKGYPRKDVK